MIAKLKREGVLSAATSESRAAAFRHQGSSERLSAVLQVARVRRGVPWIYDAVGVLRVLLAELLAEQFLFKRYFGRESSYL